MQNCVRTCSCVWLRMLLIDSAIVWSGGYARRRRSETVIIMEVIWLDQRVLGMGGRSHERAFQTAKPMVKHIVSFGVCLLVLSGTGMAVTPAAKPADPQRIAEVASRVLTEARRFGGDSTLWMPPNLCKLRSTLERAESLSRKWVVLGSLTRLNWPAIRSWFSRKGSSCRRNAALFTGRPMQCSRRPAKRASRSKGTGRNLKNVEIGLQWSWLRAVGMAA